MAEQVVAAAVDRAQLREQIQEKYCDRYCGKPTPSVSDTASSYIAPAHRHTGLAHRAGVFPSRGDLDRIGYRFDDDRRGGILDVAVAKLTTFARAPTQEIAGRTYGASMVRARRYLDDVGEPSDSDGHRGEARRAVAEPT